MFCSAPTHSDTFCDAVVSCQATFLRRVLQARNVPRRRPVRWCVALDKRSDFALRRIAQGTGNQRPRQRDDSRATSDPRFRRELGHNYGFVRVRRPSLMTLMRSRRPARASSPGEFGTTPAAISNSANCGYTCQSDPSCRVRARRTAFFLTGRILGALKLFSQQKISSLAVAAIDRLRLVRQTLA